MENNTTSNTFPDDLSGSTQQQLQGATCSALFDGMPSTAGLSTAFLGADAYALQQDSSSNNLSSYENGNNNVQSNSKKQQSNGGGNNANLDMLMAMMGMGGGGDGDDDGYYGAPPPAFDEEDEDDDAFINSMVPASYLESVGGLGGRPTEAAKATFNDSSNTNAASDPFAAPDTSFVRAHERYGNYSNKKDERDVAVVEDHSTARLLVGGNLASYTAAVAASTNKSGSGSTSTSKNLLDNSLIFDLPPIDGTPTMMIKGDNGVVRWVKFNNGSSTSTADGSVVTASQQPSSSSLDIVTSQPPSDASSSLLVGDANNNDDGSAEYEALTALFHDFNDHRRGSSGGAFESHASKANNLMKTGMSGADAQLLLANGGVLSSLSSSSASSRLHRRNRIVSFDGIDIDRLTQDAADRAERIKGEIGAREEARRAAMDEREAAANNDVAATAVATRDGQLLTAAGGGDNLHAAEEGDKPRRRDGERDETHNTNHHHHLPHSAAALREMRADAALWTGKYSPKSFVELLSDEESNLALLQWMKRWDAFVFRPRSILNNNNNKSGGTAGGGGVGGDENDNAASGPNNKKPSASSSSALSSLGGGGKKKDDAAAANAKPSTATAADPLPERPTHRIILITGPPGAGKTTMAHIIAAHCGYEVVEVNASVDRSASELERLISTSVDDRHFLQNNHLKSAANAATGIYTGGGNTGANKRGRGADDAANDASAAKRTITSSLMQRPRCLIMDEMDGVLASVTQLLLKQDINRPVICLANDLYAPSLRDLRARSSPLIIAGQLNTFSATSVGLMQLPPIKPQRLLHRLQLILRRQEDEDEVRYRQQQRLYAQQAAAQASASSSASGSVVGFTSAFPKKHKVPLTDLLGQPLLAELVHVSNGDVRTCLNTLQFLCTSILSSSSSPSAPSSTSPTAPSSSSSISTTDLQRLFTDACRKDSTMSTWSLWQTIFLRVEKSKYLTMLEKAEGGGGGGGADDAAVSTTQPHAAAAPPPPASDADIYRQYLAREDAKKAAAKLEMLRNQQRERELAEEAEKLRQQRQQHGGGGIDDITNVDDDDNDNANNNDAAANAPATTTTTISTTFATLYDPGFAYLIQHVLPLSGSQSASNSAGAGGGAMGALDMQLVLDGCFEQWPRQRFPDYNLAKTAFCALTFSFNDVISSTAFNGQGMSGLMSLSDQYGMLTAATCFACASSLSKPDNKQQFPRNDANFRACLRSSMAVVKSFLEGGSGGEGGNTSSSSSSNASAAGSVSTVPRDRLLSSSSFALHNPSTIATEVGPFLCKSLLPPTLIKFPHNFNDPSRNLTAKDLECWEASVGRHAFYGLSYRPVRLPNAPPASAGGGGGAPSAAGGGTAPPSAGPPTSGAGGGGGFGERKFGGDPNGYWALEPSIDRFCLLGLISGGPRQQVFERQPFNKDKDSWKDNNKNGNNGGGGGTSNPFGGGLSAKATKLSGGAVNPATSASGFTAPINIPLPSSSYTNTLFSNSFNPNTPVVTKNVMVSRGDVRQMLVGAVGRERIRQAKAAHDAHAAMVKRHADAVRAKQLAEEQRRLNPNPTPTTPTPTAAAPSPTTAGVPSNAAAANAAKAPLVGGLHKEQLPVLPPIPPPAAPKIKKDFFGRPIVPKAPQPAAPKTAAVQAPTTAAAANADSSAAQPSSAAAAPAPPAVIATDSLSKVRDAELLMAEKYPSMMRFCFYDGSTVGVKRAANWSDFI